MGKYSVPKEILAFKPAHTMVKRIGENYYVYSYNSVMEKTENEDGTITRKTKTTMGPCIGKITLAEGYVPNQERLSKERITGLDYGDYAFAINKSKETLDMLKKVFNVNDANQIYVAALIFFVNRFTYPKTRIIVICKVKVNIPQQKHQQSGRPAPPVRANSTGRPQ